MGGSDLMLSVSGLRGRIGESLIPSVACRYAATFGSWLRERTGTEHPSVVLGRDSRPSGPMVERAAAAGLMATGCRVVRLGLVTTPGAGVMTTHLDAEGGMVVTASHNPVVWNGLKPIRGDGAAPSADEAAELVDRYYAERWDWVGVDGLCSEVEDATAGEVHVGRIVDALDVESIRGAGLKVVLDSVNGAGGPSTADLLERLGVEGVHIGADPTGWFAHPPEPLPDHLTELAEAVRTHGAAVGLAQDPDADRLALVDERGVCVSEEYTLALAAQHVLRRSPGSVVANLSTSRRVDDMAAVAGQEVFRTPVGEANVAARMAEVDAVVGGEGNGGVIWPAVGRIRDSLAGIGLLLEMLAERGSSLRSLVESVPAYAMVKRKVTLSSTSRAVHAIREAYADAAVDIQDGVRVDLPDRRWVHVRPSNTEPVVRIIAEAADADGARSLLEEVHERLEQVQRSGQ